MCADEYDRENFEETLREIAREVGESVERAMERFDLDELAGTIGMDAERARGWVDSASGWLRSQFEHLGDEMAAQASSHAGPRPKAAAAADPWRSAAPHPLDVPTDEQGPALAALDSGRWEVELGTNRLIAHGEGPGPSDALGLVRELRARDWIGADGRLTVAGRHALSRWLDSSG